MYRIKNNKNSNEFRKSAVQIKKKETFEGSISTTKVRQWLNILLRKSQKWYQYYKTLIFPPFLPKAHNVQ